MFKLLIFDLDGTLIDSASDIASSLNQLLARHNKPLEPYGKIVSHIGEGIRGLMKDFFPPHEADRYYEEFLQIYEQNLVSTTRLFPGVNEFLKTWQQHGQMAIVTNKVVRLAEPIVNAVGLGEFPWVRVLGADSLERKKPDPLPLQEVMRVAGVHPHETVMIGDGTPDMQAATRAGVTPIAIGFGYTKPERLQELGAKAVLAHYDELMPVLRECFHLRG